MIDFNIVEVQITIFLKKITLEEIVTFMDNKFLLKVNVWCIKLCSQNISFFSSAEKTITGEIYHDMLAETIQ